MYNRRLPKYAFGANMSADSVNPYVNAAGFAGDVITAIAPNSGVGSAVSMGAKGAAIGTAIAPGIGTVIGGVAGLIGGIFGNSRRKRLEEEAKRKQRLALQEQERAIIKGNDAALLAGYDSNGVNSYGYYGKGGYLPKYNNGGSISTGTGTSTGLATNVSKFTGASHANGGIPIDTNADGLPEAEVEGGEVQKDDLIYSDRLKPSESVKEGLKKYKINVKKNDTYADVAETLGKKKGKYEGKLLSHSSITLRTGKAMSDKYDQLLEEVFIDQEVTKPTTNTQVMAYGGYLPKYAKGGKRLPLVNPTSGVGITQNPTLTNTGVVPYTIPTSYTPQPKTSSGLIDKIGNIVNDYGSDILNVASYIGNNNTISKMKAPTARYIASAPYNYTDRSGLARYENAVATRSAMRAVTNSSSQGRSAERAMIQAQGLNNLNQINNNENIRRDGYTNNYLNRNFQTQAINTQIANNNAEQVTGIENEKLALRQQNRSMLMQGIAANQAVRSQQDLDFQKALVLLAQAPDPERAINVLMKGMSPENQKRLQQALRRRG